MKILLFLSLLISVHNLGASEVHMAFSDFKLQVSDLSEQQLDRLKDKAEFLYPDDPYRQWYYIMLVMEADLQR